MVVLVITFLCYAVVITIIAIFFIAFLSSPLKLQNRVINTYRQGYPLFTPATNFLGHKLCMELSFFEMFFFRSETWYSCAYNQMYWY